MKLNFPPTTDLELKLTSPDLIASQKACVFGLIYLISVLMDIHLNANATEKNKRIKLADAQRQKVYGPFQSYRNFAIGPAN